MLKYRRSCRYQNLWVNAYILVIVTEAVKREERKIACENISQTDAEMRKYVCH